jgi:hypothetical protein
VVGLVDHLFELLQLHVVDDDLVEHLLSQLVDYQEHALHSLGLNLRFEVVQIQVNLAHKLLFLLLVDILELTLHSLRVDHLIKETLHVEGLYFLSLLPEDCVVILKVPRAESLDELVRFKVRKTHISFEYELLDSLYILLINIE